MRTILTADFVPITQLGSLAFIEACDLMDAYTLRCLDGPVEPIKDGHGRLARGDGLFGWPPSLDWGSSGGSRPSGPETTAASLRDRVSLNPNWVPIVSAPASDRGADVEAFHRSLPGFRSSPLVELPDLADLLGAHSIHVKYEAERLGLPSFKVVGASWAVNCAIAERLATDVPLDFVAMTALARRLPTGAILTTATDGNHGRAVAHVARLVGLPSRIFIPAAMASARVAAIKFEGADVITIDGSYDDAVQCCADDAACHPARLLVSDTSWSGYESIPARVVEGYGTIFREACTQLLDGDRFDVAFIPAGVGALACSAVHSLHSSGCAVVTVEPVDADCVRRSLVAGTPVVVPGLHRSILAGLNCGRVSRIAWPALRGGVTAAVAVTDDEARNAVRLLAGQGIPSGESGAASLAGAAVLSAVGGDLAERKVLLLDTEGVTDPDAYARIIAPS